MKQILYFISLAVLLFGLYLKFIYDVPDSEEKTNYFVSGFLIIMGISTLLINLFWDNTEKPKEKNE